MSPSDIWAFGTSAKTAGQMIGMHWNGRSWSTLAVPRYTLSGKPAGVQSMIALGPDNVWAAESLPAPCGPCQQPPPSGTILAHWNGRGWREVIKDTSDAYQSGLHLGQGALAADGSGGLWLDASNAKYSSTVVSAGAHHCRKPALNEAELFVRRSLRAIQSAIRLWAALVSLASD